MRWWWQADGEFVSADRSSENIYTRLLLQSEIRGNIEDPGWYFESQTPERAYALDLVLLTHGWSRYNWDKILERHPFKYEPEDGIAFSGQITYGQKPAINVPFTLASSQEGNNFFNVYETDSLGNFKIGSLDFAGRTQFSWRVMKGRKGRVSGIAQIQLDTIPDIPTVVPMYGRQFVRNNRNPFIDKEIRRLAAAKSWNLEQATILDEVVIKGARKDVFSIGNFKGIKPSELDLRSRISTLDLVRRQALPSKIYGLSINGFEEEEGSDIPLRLLGIPIETIANVVIAGDIHNGYFVAINTKDPEDVDPLGTIKISMSGYDLIREFYHPKYPSADSLSAKPDNRITLYWNGNLRTDKDGTARVIFFNNDSARKFLVTAEGIANSTPVTATKVIGKD